MTEYKGREALESHPVDDRHTILVHGNRGYGSLGRLGGAREGDTPDFGTESLPAHASVDGTGGRAASLAV